MRVSLPLLALATLATAFRARESVSPREYRPNDGLVIESALATKGPPAPVALPTTAVRQSVVNPILNVIDKSLLTSWITRLTQFPDRYYKSLNGVAATNWTLAQVQALQPVAGTRLTVKNFPHSWGFQPSVIARYEATSGPAPDSIVITGSHIDTIARGPSTPEPNANPAADDCASGSGVVFETLRSLVTSGFIPGRPIEFHWYSGEEEGIYGSNEVAEAYAKAGTKVLAYLNLDQSGYVKPGTKPVLGVITDYTDTTATTLIKSTLSAYSTLPFVTDKCGYKCTDNSAWYDHGYIAAMAVESKFADSSPNSDRANSDGSPLDTLDTLDFDHIVQLTRNAIGFVVELSLHGSSSTTSTTTTNPTTTTTRTTTTSTTTTKPTTTTTTTTTTTKTTTKTTTTPTCTKTRGPQRRGGGSGGC